jgi:hypothetical protein
MHGLRKFLLNAKDLSKLNRKVIKNPDSRLVLILSFPRSGTHALASMIDHKEFGLLYYGEFFMFNHWSPMVERLNKFIPFFSWRYYINNRRQRRKWTTFRFEQTTLDVLKTLDAMLAFPGTHIVKLFPEHLHLETLEQVLSKYKPHVIILRRNHLDRYVSLKKANASGKWHKVNSSEIQVDIDKKELMHYVNKYDDWYKKVKKSAHGCPILDIGFEKLHDAATVSKIQEFILLDKKDVNSLPKSPTTTKMDKSSKLQEDFLTASNMSLADFNFVEIS